MKAMIKNIMDFMKNKKGKEKWIEVEFNKILFIKIGQSMKISYSLFLCKDGDIIISIFLQLKGEKLMAQAQLTEKIILTQTQKEVLYGALLGDGCLYKHKNGINAQFTYLSKSKQHTEYVANFFKDYWSGEGLKDKSYFDNRTNKIYYNTQIRTYTNPTFTEEYSHWYKDGIKHIPEDLILTPLICLIWYIGDGGISSGGSGRTESIKLSTQCFPKEEQDRILIPQLKAFEATTMKTGINKDGDAQYIIYIPHRKEKEFLDYIGDCPFEDYSYKWDIKEYINNPPTIRDYSDIDKTLCDLYLNGKSYYAIAKEFNLPPANVRRRLIKNNIYKVPDKKIKNAIVQIKNDEYIQIYESGAEAGRQLGLSSSMISSVKSGNRKMKDGSTFKMYKDLTEEEQILVKEKFIDYFETEEV